MNSSLLRSWHAIPAIGAILGLVAWALLGVADGPFGLAGGRSLQLTSGWFALALLAIAFGYVLRKYAHKRRYSPEFAMRREFAAIERANDRVIELLPRIKSGALASKRDVERAAKKILVDEGVHRVNRVEVEAGAPGEPAWRVRIRPTEPLGRMRRWMHAHLYYGGAFGFVVAVHARGGVDSATGIGLALLAATVWLTGAWGLYFWLFGPSMLTRAERDLSIEEAYALAESLERKLDGALDELPPNERAVFERVAASGDPRAATAALDELRTANTEAQGVHRDLMALVVQRMRVADEYGRLARVRSRIMSWKLVHVPAAIALAGLALLHAATILRY